MASILIIDDEESIRVVLRKVLEQAGYEVRDAATGKEGLRLARTTPPALVITDVLMPDTDGFEVLRALRGEKPALPLIVITGASEEKFDYVEAARLLGARRVLKKPCSIPALLQAVEEVLQHSSPSVSASRREDNVTDPSAAYPRRSPDGVAQESGGADGRADARHERRRFPRAAVQCPIVVIKDGTTIGNGRTYDLSAGGCAAESRAPVSKGEYVALHLDLPGHRDPTTPLQVDLAAVRWTSHQKIGLEFITMPSEDQQRLRQYMDTLRTPAF